jgi:hypothetical protein
VRRAYSVMRVRHRYRVDVIPDPRRQAFNSSFKKAAELSKVSEEDRLLTIEEAAERLA